MRGASNAIADRPKPAAAGISSRIRQETARSNNSDGLRNQPPANPHRLIGMQRTHGNQVVLRMLQGATGQISDAQAEVGQPQSLSRVYAPVVARACMTKEECEKKTEKTPEDLLKEETSKPENKSKRDKRKQACTSTPRDASCTADGHGKRAVQAEKVLHDWDPQRLKFIKQIVVDMDMESGFGGLTGDCSDFMPPILGGGLCTFIPERLEKESEQFNTTMDPSIAGKPRDIWRDAALMTLVHETEHARFDVTRIAQPGPRACKFDDIEDALSEIAAMLVEFPIIFRAARENVSLTPQRRVEILDKWFKVRITNDRQSFKSTLHAIYCKCECADADVYVKKTIAFSTADWSDEEKQRFHTELNDPKWDEHKLRWPVKPPAKPGQAAPTAKTESSGTP